MHFINIVSWEMAQWVKYLISKYKDLGFHPQHTHSMLAMMELDCNQLSGETGGTEVLAG